MAGRQRYTTDQVMAALKECNGLVYLTAKRLGCSSRTILRHLARTETLREVVAECREHRVDLAEAALDRAVEAGESWAVTLLLKSLGKSRGYYDKTQVDVGKVDEIITAELARVTGGGQAGTAGAAPADAKPST